MKRIVLNCLALGLCICSISSEGIAQTYKRICVMGSSTTFGYFGNPATYPRDSAWAFKLKKYYKDAGVIDTLFNIAANGTDCYTGMPSSYTPPPGRNTPGANFNITKAVNLLPKPDVIIVNYPTNNYDWLPNAEIIYCLQTIKDSANAKNIKCYITTTQPRDNFNTAERQKLKELKTLIESTFGIWAIDFWTDVVQDPPILIRTAYAFGDMVHLNPAGHTVLKNKVIEKNIFFGGVLAVAFTNFRVEKTAQTSILSWQTSHEDNNSHFIAERSTNGTLFEKIMTIPGHTNSSQVNNYRAIDESPAGGINYYRIAAISQAGEKQYSGILKINHARASPLFSFSRPALTSDYVSVVLEKTRQGYVDLVITDVHGRQLWAERIRVDRQHTHHIPVSNLSAGTYILSAGADGQKQAGKFIRE